MRLNDAHVGLCHACAQGWGTCRTEHRCQVMDGFQDLHKAANEADGYVVVSPVYFGELSESAKAFFDRLRRCEATRGDESGLADKPMLGVAAAGGSGGGTTTCLDQMNRLFIHLRGNTWDLVPITRKSRAVQGGCHSSCGGGDGAGDAEAKTDKARTSTRTRTRTRKDNGPARRRDLCRMA